MKLTKLEWDALLLAPDVIDRLVGAEGSGVLKATFPEVFAIVGFGGGQEGHKDLWAHTCKVVSQCPEDTGIRWAALFHDVGKPSSFFKKGGEIAFHGHEMKSFWLFQRAANRTKLFSVEEAERISFLIKNLGHVEEYDPSWTDSAVRRLYKLAGGHFNDLLALSRADITTKHASKRQALHARIQELSDRAETIAAEDNKVPALAKGIGTELTTAFGIPPSRQLGDLMKRLIEDVEAGKLPRQAEPSVVIEYVRTAGLV